MAYDLLHSMKSATDISSVTSTLVLTNKSKEVFLATSSTETTANRKLMNQNGVNSYCADGAYLHHENIVSKRMS